MSNTGWIKLHRKITDHWLWEDKPFARGQAMIDLLILAGYNDQPKYVDGNLETVERGSVGVEQFKSCQIFKNTRKRQYYICKKRH